MRNNNRATRAARPALSYSRLHDWLSEECSRGARAARIYVHFFDKVYQMIT